MFTHSAINGTSSCGNVYSTDFQPVCDSNGTTHSNECHFKLAACEAKKKNLLLTMAHKGPCQGSGEFSLRCLLISPPEFIFIRPLASQTVGQSVGWSVNVQPVFVSSHFIKKVSLPISLPISPLIHPLVRPKLKMIISSISCCCVQRPQRFKAWKTENSHIWK